MKKRIISLFLALVMLFSCLSLNVFAAEEVAASGDTEQKEVGTLVSQKLKAHTDAEMKAAIMALTTVKNSSGTPKYSWSAGKTHIQNTDSSRIRYTEDGRVVVGARSDATKTSNQSYMQFADHTDWSSRNLIQGYANHYAKGKAITASLDIEFTDEFIKNTIKDVSVPLLQVAVYQTTQGRDGKNPNQLGTYMPNLLYLKTDGTTVTLYANVRGGSLVSVCTLEKNTPYTIAVHLDPQDYEPAANVYGSFDVFVDGECKMERVGFATSGTNTAMTFSVENPVAYFVDGSYSGYDTFKGGKAYFFLPKGTVLDTSDTDGDGIPEIYEHVHGINAENAALITGYECIGTSNGVRDMCLGFVRVLQIPSDSKAVSYESDAVYLDNIGVFYSDEYVDFADHSFEPGDHAHDVTSATTDVTYNCKFCDSYKVITELFDANADNVCDICVPVPHAGYGVLPTDKIAAYADSVILASADGKTGNMSFNAQGVMVPVTEDGNTYYKFGPPTQTVELAKGDYPTYMHQDNTGFYWRYQVATANNYEKLKGKSYVLSADLKLFDTISEGINVLGSMCYMNGSDGCTAISNLEIIYFLNVLADGTLRYRDGSKVNSKGEAAFVSTGVNIKDGKFHTLSIHHTPYNNSFDVYVDGDCIITDAQAVTDADAKKMTFTSGQLEDFSGNAYTPDTVTYNGPSDYIPAVFRSHQYNEKTSSELTADQFALDNIKIYYAENYFEHIHNYEMNHSHGIMTNTATVTYSCNCGKTQTYNVRMHDTVNGEDLTPAEIQTAAGTNFITATDFTGANITVGTPATVSKFGIVNHWGAIHAKTEDGNTFLEWGEKTVEGKDTSYAQFLPGTNNWNTVQNLVNADSPIVGAPYVISLDFMHYGVQDVNIIQQIASYTHNNSSTKTVSLSVPLKVTKEGVLQYSDGGTTKNSTFTLFPGSFYNFVFIHTPKTNSYDVFVDGELVLNDIKALSDSNATASTWTNSNGKLINGAKSFTVGFVRTHMLSSSYTGPALFAIDNPTMYYGDVNLECKHSYVNGKCEWCDFADDDFGRCDICDGHAISEHASVVGKSASLGELIDMNLYVKYLTDNAGVTAALIAGDKAAEFALDALDEDEDGNYKLSLGLNSIMMAENVTLSIDGGSYSTSIKAYAEELIAASSDVKTQNVAKALLNFGAAAQEYFALKNGNAALTDLLANAGLSEADKTITDVTETEAFTTIKFNYTDSNTADRVTFTASTLTFSSKTHVKIYFTASEAAKVTLDGKNITPKADGEEYYIAYTINSPADLFKTSTIVITDGESSYQADVSAALIIMLGVTGAEDAELVPLLKAYAYYATCATEYVNA